MPVDTSAATRARHRDLVEHHPADAVRLLERLAPSEAAQILAALPPESTLPVWERLAPDLGAQILAALSRRIQRELGAVACDIWRYDRARMRRATMARPAASTLATRIESLAKSWVSEP